jgi:hypothetical protein
MAKLNEVKYAALTAALPKAKWTLNGAEHAWLELQGATAGKTLNEKWYEVFARSGVSWNESAHIWLTTQGVSEGGTLNERFFRYWTALAPPPVVINMPDLSLTTGSLGQWVGFRRGGYGSITPDQLSDGNLIRRLRVRNSTGRTDFRVQGLYPQDEFTTMEIVGAGGGVLNTVDATFSQANGKTLWRWNGTANILSDATVYVVNFT